MCKNVQKYGCFHVADLWDLGFSPAQDSVWHILALISSRQPAMTCSTAFLALDFGNGLTSLNWVAQAIQTQPKADSR